MLVVLVDVRVKPESVAAFKKASVENARHSLQEPGIVRFDLIQANDEPTRFMLVEIYQTDDDNKKHKETAHYRTWRDTVEKMMAAPRSSSRYTDVFYTR
jgi:(4S)-4-hydroxy-5-phosphonooxypentane-2,3-dione isomerase